jgi:D-alanyl-D-alanine endopeptidase (penicillin-binding protein 7)
MKKIINSILIIGSLIAAVFLISWIYGQNIIQSQKNPDNSIVSDSFYFSTGNQSVGYPFRNWEKRDLNINAEVALMVDIDTDYVFFQKNSNLRRPIASVSKLMTALVAEKYIPKDQNISVDAEAIHIEGDSGNGLAEGEIFSSNNLMRLMLLASSNKSAYALANFFGFDSFIAKMNEEAKNIGLTQTSFVEPSGLNMSNQSTAEDLKKLAQTIIKENPNIFVITQDASETINSVGEKSKPHLIKNINLFSQSPKSLEEMGIQYLGGKTGSTDEAKEAYVGIFSIPSSRFEGQKIRVLTIILASPTRYSDIESMLRWIKQAYVF